MIRVIKQIDQDTVEIESDAGKYLDTGLIPQKTAIVNKCDLKYVREVNKEEADNSILQLKKVYSL